MTVQTLTHHARLKACLADQIPDRTPIALWRHFPVDDQTPDGLAAATAAFQHAYDFDLIKVTPSSSFCIKDWGVEDRWTGNPEGTRDYTRHVIHRPEDWKKLPVLDPTRGQLGDQLTCLRLLVQEFRPDTPILQTIFSPMTQAKNLVGGENLLVHMRRYPDALREGLETITQSTIRFVEKAIKTGIDGVFFAVQHAQFGILSKDETNTFERTYDLRVMEAARDLWLNFLHLHGSEVDFDLAVDFPAAVVNWHDRETIPSLKEGQERFRGTVCGGLRQWETMVLSGPDQVRTEAERAIQETGGRRFILGTGCVLPVTAPYGNIQAARQAAGIPII